MKHAFVVLVLLCGVVAVAADPPFYQDKFNLLHYLDVSGEPQEVRNKQDWRKRREHILANMQVVMGPVPNDPKPPLAINVIREDDFGDIVRRKITYQAKKGDHVNAYLFIPKKRAGRVPGMVVPHPTSVKFGKGIVAGVGGRPRRASALELAERGYVTIAPDYPYMGEPQTSPYDLGYVSTTMKGIYNHMRAVDLLQSMDEVDPERIGAIGHSLGGHNSLFLAAFDERVKVAVTSCGFNAFHQYKGGDLWGWSQDKYMPRIADRYDKDPGKMPFDFSEVLGAIAPRAVFINAPINDANFEVSGVRRCYDAVRLVYARIFNEPDKLVAHYPVAEHDFPDETRFKAYAFLDKLLKGH
jgi:dienelactone hydrolase